MRCAAGLRAAGLSMLSRSTRQHFRLQRKWQHLWRKYGIRCRPPSISHELAEALGSQRHHAIQFELLHHVMIPPIMPVQAAGHWGLQPSQHRQRGIFRTHHLPPGKSAIWEDNVDHSTDAVSCRSPWRTPPSNVY